MKRFRSTSPTRAAWICSCPVREDRAVDLLLADGKIDQLEERLRRLRDAAEKETA